jgi:hypothetical protein
MSYYRLAEAERTQFGFSEYHFGKSITVQGRLDILWYKIETTVHEFRVEFFKCVEVKVIAKKLSRKFEHIRVSLVVTVFLLAKHGIERQKC